MHPMDSNLVGYLLGALDDETYQAVEGYLRTHPEARRKLDRLRRIVAPLELDRAAPEPPSHLVAATLTRVAEKRSPLPPAPRVPRSQLLGRDWWRRADVLAAAAVLLIAVGVGISWLAGGWQRSSMIACQENLHKFHRALAAYSEQRPDGAFPQVKDEGALSFAGAFVPALADAGVLPRDISLSCPAEGSCPPSLEPGQIERLVQLYHHDRERYAQVVRATTGYYAYSLGYRDGRGLCGLNRDSGGTHPIMADRPPFPAQGTAQPGNSLAHGGNGQFILFTDGSARYVTSRVLGGSDGDDIYVNINYRVRAGAHSRDAVLASGDGQP
jgi:hypothetical protein